MSEPTAKKDDDETGCLVAVGVYGFFMILAGVLAFFEGRRCGMHEIERDAVIHGAGTWNANKEFKWKECQDTKR